MGTLSLSILFAALAGPAFAQPAGKPACAAEAVEAARKLLKLHTDADDRASVDAASLRGIGTVKALVGGKPLDVVEVEGHVYKANYRIRLIYARIPGTCALMGQEILERSNPY